MRMGSPVASSAVQPSGPSSTVRAYVLKARNSLAEDACVGSYRTGSPARGAITTWSQNDSVRGGRAAARVARRSCG